MSNQIDYKECPKAEISKKMGIALMSISMQDLWHRKN